MNYNPGINNKKWQLILIPLVIVPVCILISFNSNNSLFQFPWQLFTTLCIFTFVIWQVNLITYRRLDKTNSFYDEPGKRLILQIFYCCAATWATYAVLYFISYFIQGGSWQKIPWSSFFFYLIVATGISIFINSLYIIRYLQTTLLFKETVSTQKMNDLLAALDSKNHQLPAEIVPEKANTNSNLVSMIVEAGPTTLNIAFLEMAYWYSSQGLVILVLADGKKLSTNFSSFAVFAHKLPDDYFFQLNRQFITHLNSIVSITDDSNRKLIVELAAVKSTGKKEKVYVSRYRSQELKQWFYKRMAK
ncbi:MAG: LytTR family transcriptional regulator [Gloeobacteraceae cyanobacterium ES-bin-316]|nr:LytTR family transcriptional regulator [Ferruginibacter sp.]